MGRRVGSGSSCGTAQPRPLHGNTYFVGLLRGWKHSTQSLVLSRQWYPVIVTKIQEFKDELGNA